MHFSKKTISSILFTGLGVFMSFLGTPSVSYGADCSIVSATFNPYTGQGDLAQDGWFDEATRTTKNKVTISIKTANCAEETISVSLSGYQDSLDEQTGGWLPSFSRDVDILNDKDYVVPASEQFTINLVAGEESCKLNVLPWNSGIAGYSDCQFFVSVSTGLLSSNYTSRGKTQGNLDYECDGGCEENGPLKWLYVGDTSAIPYTSDPEAVKPPNPVITTGEAGAVDTSDKCYNASTGKIDPNCYSIYSGLSEVFKIGETKLEKITSADSLGAFLNALIAIAIGVAGVACVLLIMYDGFTYWTAGKAGNESKMGDVKGRVWKRLLGLLVLLTIYTLLRTINPDLLNLTPRINLALLDQEEQGDGGLEPESFSDEGADLSTIKPGACTEGLEKVYGFIACKTIAPKLKSLIDAAKADNIILTGGGFRTLEHQISLRKKNCGGDEYFNIYKKRASACTPPTAIPGTSRHEQGLAFDFACNGKGIINVSKRKETEICFNWLKVHAGKYGLKNLPSENWHWSIDGK
jgi:hypothetical protein